MKENFKIFFARIEKVTCKDQKIAQTLKSLGISLKGNHCIGHFKELFHKSRVYLGRV